MIGWGIVLAVIVLLLLTKVGVHVRYGDELALSAKVGLLRIRILPAKEKKPKEKKPEKKKKKKKPKAAEGHEKKKQKLTLEDILGIVKLGLKALGRFGRALRLDRLHLHLCVAKDDPYDTVAQYGYLNAALGAGLPLLHRAFKIKDEDITTAFRFDTTETALQCEVIATLRIGAILRIGLCAGGGFLVWLIRRKRRAKALKKAEKKKLKTALPAGAE